MADYVVYPLDRAVNTTTVSSSVGTTAARVVDLDQTTFFYPGASASAITIYGDLGSSRAISAVAFGNLTDMGGRTVTVYKGNAPGGIDTPLVAKLFGTRKHYVVTFNSTSLQYWTVQVSTTSATTRIGTISVLDNSASLSIASPAAPQFPNYQVDPGFLTAQLATGNPITQVQAGPSIIMQFVFQNVPTSDGLLFDRMLESLENYYGWARGVWITDDTMASNIGRGFYGVPMPGVPVLGQSIGGNYGQVSLSLMRLPLGVE